MMCGSPLMSCGSTQHCRVVRGLSVLLLVSIVACAPQEAPPAAPSPAPAASLEQARRLLKDGDVALAEQVAEAIARSDPDWEDAQLIAGEAALKSGAPLRSLDHYLLLARESDDLPRAAEGHYYAAEVYRELGRLAEAEASYRAVLEVLPGNAATHERLALLLSACGRTWEARTHFWFLVKSGSVRLEELSLFADLDRSSDQRPFLLAAQAKSPDDPLVQLGLALHDYWEGHTAQALGRLEPLLEQHPEYIVGQ